MSSEIRPRQHGGEELLVIDFSTKDESRRGVKASITALARNIFQPLTWPSPVFMKEGEEWYEPFPARGGKKLCQELYRLRFDHCFGRIVAFPVLSVQAQTDVVKFAGGGDFKPAPAIIDTIHELWLEPLDQGWQNIVRNDHASCWRNQVGRRWRNTDAKWYRTCDPKFGTVEVLRSKARAVQRLSGLCGVGPTVYAETYNGWTSVRPS